MKKNNLDNIIEKVWLGNYIAAEDFDDLKNKNIKKILTIMDESFPKNKYEGITYKKINISDTIEENIICHFGECLKFIKGEDNILVHCKSGASRSATIVIAFIMWDKKMSYHNALNLTKEKRFVVFPNHGFRKQLELFEKLLKENDYDINKIKFEEIKWDLKDNL